MVVQVTPIPHQQDNIFAALVAHELLHEALLRIPLQVCAGADPPAWPAILTGWLVDEKRIKSTARQLYLLLFLHLFTLARPPPPTGTGPSIAGSRKRAADDMSTCSSEASLSPASPTKSACNGKRFPAIEKLHTAHAKFWQYLPVAAKLSVTHNREPRYMCACGKELNAAQAYNFGRHASKCAPGILPEKAGTNWPADNLPPLVPPVKPSDQECTELAKLSATELLQIPERWRVLIVVEAAPAALSAASAPPAALPEIPPELPQLRGAFMPDFAGPPPVADAQIVNQLPPGSLIAAMTEQSDFHMNPSDFNSG